jgi:hypothetical protein
VFAENTTAYSVFEENTKIAIDELIHYVEEVHIKKSVSTES